LNSILAEARSHIPLGELTNHIAGFHAAYFQRTGETRRGGAEGGRKGRGGIRERERKKGKVKICYYMFPQPWREINSLSSVITIVLTISLHFTVSYLLSFDFKVDDV